MVGNMVKTVDMIQKTNVPINVTSIDDVDSGYDKSDFKNNNYCTDCNYSNIGCYICDKV